MESVSEFMRRQVFVRWPEHGNLLEALRAGRLESARIPSFNPACGW